MTYDWNVGQNVISGYVAACKEFVNDDEKFNNFKQDSRYKVILEHISKEESETFISEMKNKKLLTKTKLKSLKENDLYGNPELHEYELFEQISPSTIRYIKNTLDIFDFIKNQKKDEIKNIVEIGGGYGGLCKTLSVFFKFDNYALIDLPEANGLTRKYLSNFKKLYDKVQCVDYNAFDEILDIDLVISNYAFSECSLEVQTIYYNHVIKNSKYFYMVYNNMTHGNMNPSQFLDFASNDFDILVEEEIRPSHKNYIFYGSRK